jgi:hypothetical protein
VLGDEEILQIVVDASQLLRSAIVRTGAAADEDASLSSAFFRLLIVVIRICIDRLGLCYSPEQLPHTALLRWCLRGQCWRPSC